MSFWKSIKSLKISYMFEIGKLFIRHPFFAFATLKATYNTYRISQKHFPDIHGRENKANAFRHCLWNILIAKEAKRFSKSLDEVINWAKTITDLHEDLAPNKPLSRAMDLHNNAIGRKWFLDVHDKSEEEIVSFIKLNFTDAVKIDSLSALNTIDNLVFLED